MTLWHEASHFFWNLKIATVVVIIFEHGTIIVATMMQQDFIAIAKSIGT